MATENGFFTNQTQFQNDPNVSQRDNLKGFYGTAVRPAYVEDLVAKAEEAAAKSYEYSQDSKQYRDEAEVIRDETQAINDQTDQVYLDTVQVYNDTVVQANNAAQSATNAAQHEAGAANSAVIAAGFAADAEAAFDNFNDLYLGAKPVDPTTDNDGNPLQVGATYWNSTTHDLRFWSGATWDIPEQTAIQAANTAVSASDSAQVSATNAATSETNAAQSAADALASQNVAALAASSANTSANNAAQSESNAATSESNAATSASNAATSEANAAQSAADAQQSAEDAANTLSEIEWKQFVRNEAELNQMREQNKSVRAASGFDHYGKHWGGNAPQNGNINEGLWCASNNAYLALGRNPNDSLFGESETTFPVAHIAGFISSIVSSNPNTPGYERSYIKFPEAPDGTVTYNSATGEVIKHADASTAFALADTSDDIEVVINRVDMFGSEFFLEEVSQANPFVYPKGMIQSQATSMNGITTTTSNRPVTYYAVYDGDTGSQGKGVDFWAATDEQKKAMVSDEANNIFMLDDGRLVQWRMRQRTIAGAGNGDWHKINSNDNIFQFAASASAVTGRRVRAQGIEDSSTPYIESGSGTWYAGTDFTTYNTTGERGVFRLTTEGAPSNIAVNGECYFHVWGVVPRLNQGAYHPSLNPMGAKHWNRTDGNGGIYWYAAESNTGTSTAQAFHQTVVAGEVGARTPTGAIGQSTSRPDGKFYDAIYASGQGGVIDYRLPSWDMSSKEEASKVFQKVVNGSYRGEEALYGSKVYSLGSVTNDYSAGNYRRMNCTAPNLVPLNCSTSFGRNDALPHFDYDAPRVGFIVNGDTGQVYRATQTRADESGVTRIYLSQDTSNAPANIANAYFVVSPNRPPSGGVTGDDADIIFTDSAVSGDFSQVDVIGNPAEILATPSLANGWLGGWVPYVNTGSGETVPLTRKSLSSTAVRISTTNNGSSWATANANIISTTNHVSTSGTTSWVSLQSYTALAKQTKETSAEKKVLNGVEGVGYVWASEHYNNWTGVSLVESLIGKTPTNSSADYFMGEYTVTNLNGIFNGLLTWTSSDRDAPEHAPITLSQPNNNSPAVKTLWYQTSDNGQASLFLPYNELVYKTYTTPITDTGAQMLRKRGEIYIVDDVNSVLNGRLVIWNGSDGNIPVTYSSYYVDANNVVRSKSSNTASTIQLYSGNGWGDDSTVRIKYGSSTYINMNGDTCLCGTAELSIPYGYTKNQARAGEQTEGVDL